VIWLGRRDEEKMQNEGRSSEGLFHEVIWEIWVREKTDNSSGSLSTCDQRDPGRQSEPNIHIPERRAGTQMAIIEIGPGGESEMIYTGRLVQHILLGF
jgi:hypothetical protein